MADLTEKENARLRKALQDAIDSGRFKNKTALAREMKIAQPSLTEIMLGGGASLATARKAAKVLGAAFYEAPGVARETVADEDAVIDPRILEFVRSGAVSAKAAEMLGPFAGGAAKRTDVELLTALKAAENALSLVADTGEDEKPRRRR